MAQAGGARRGVPLHREGLVFELTEVRCPANAHSGAEGGRSQGARVGGRARRMPLLECRNRCFYLSLSLLTKKAGTAALHCGAGRAYPAVCQNDKCWFAIDKGVACPRACTL